MNLAMDANSSTGSLDHQTAELLAVIESISDGVFIGDRNGISRCNRAALAQLGFATVAELNRPVEALAREIDMRDPATGEMLSHEEQPFVIALGGLPCTREFMLTNVSTGQQIIVRCAASPVEIDGKIVGAVAVNTDVTALRRAQAELEELNRTLEQRVAAAIAQREEAEASLRQAQKMDAIGHLTGSIAHDFNNFLTAISGSLELLQPIVVDERGKRCVSTALAATERSTKLTQQLLAFARKQAITPARVDLEALIAGMNGLLRQVVGHEIAVEIRQTSGVWPIFVDAGQLESMLLNLAINARDAMPHGGVLSIVAANFAGGDAALPPDVADRDCVGIALSDTGTGMSQDVLDRAFEPFFTTKEVGKRTGLGLAMAFSLAKQSGGTIRLQSEVGAGTTVELFFPRAGNSSESC
ncbi:MAG: response regulator [Rhodospirillales bacterium]|nr:response regulator [Rhodospirillales bacterium]